MKYFVIRTTRSGIEYKRYKCSEGWTRNKSICWQFSKQGAQKIADRLNENYAIPNKEHYNILKAE